MTRYLRNAWYAAAFADEVAEVPLARTLLDVDMVLFRRSDGTVALLEDRCAHRFAPLSQGRVKGDEIECGYHGLRFDGSGACTHNPHSGGEPARPGVRVRAWPALERDGFIWFWPGDPDRRDEALLPRFPFLSDPDRFSTIKGRLHVRGHYQLVVDNLLDLSHAAYLHPEFAASGVSAERALAATTTRLERRGRTVYNYRLRSGLPSPGPSRRLFGFGDEPMNSKSHMTWHPPAVLDFDLGQWEVGTPEEDGLALPQAHVITPETEFTSHYFFANARNRRLNDPEVDQALLKVFDTAFRTQDEPMIEAVQRRMGRVSDIRELKPVLLATDAAPLAARRLLARLIADEDQADGRPAAGPDPG